MVPMWEIQPVTHCKRKLSTQGKMKTIDLIKDIPSVIKRILRVITVKNHSEIVWKELIKLHKKEGWHFGQFDKEKIIETTFFFENAKIYRKFRYAITQQKLIFNTEILSDFQTESTHDVMILASHFNSLLTSGVVRVDTIDRKVHYEYSSDLTLYALYPGELHNDLARHFLITQDCFWAYTQIMETNEDPVFIIAELLKRNEKEV
jgi:hypothetical protein